ncbi:hypothetical protein TRFO_40697 [Tritrichomonas foetus]|uniref:Uncharacterized protein n=1 Tax=Tritrichomonas foetus TaxID=1144522 RepID=A0A1J4J079_9EUKA|nr:hypothetical protein TRFO_40697 [Tritrichomonas foetus]|eukprot:OHS93000.1 hypothetical protein TRFO_40697 [Tritrichomonas foetus]
MAVTNQEIKTKYFIIPKINPNASIEVWREGRVKNHIDFISDYLMDRSDISSQNNGNNHIKKKIRFLFIFTKNEMNTNELHELFDHIPVTKASNFIAIKEMEITNPQLYFYPVPSFFEDLIKSMAGKVEHKEEQDKNARIFSCTFNSILGTKRNIQNAKMIATFISAFPRFKTKINIVDDILQIPFFTIKISNFKEKQLKQYKHEELTQNEKRKRLIYNPSVVRKSKKIIVPCKNLKIAHSLMNELNFQTYFNETISTKKYLLSSFYKKNIKYYILCLGHYDPLKRFTSSPPSIQK